MQLQGKYALITGASSGIGRATALAFARAGADVVVAARREKELVELAEEIRALGRKAVVAAIDVSSEHDVGRMMQLAMAEFPTLDILVNNAGIARTGYVDTMPVADWDATFAVNVRGTFLCTRAVLPLLKAQRRGVIINVASSDRGLPDRSAYSASKFAIVAFTQALADEVKDFGISVNCVRFGVVVDTPLARAVHHGVVGEDWQQPEDVTGVLLWLAAQEGTAVTGGYINTYEWVKQLKGPLWKAATPPPATIVDGQHAKGGS